MSDLLVIEGSDSVLITIKKLLGIDRDDTSFDLDIMMHINSALLNLDQLGLGTKDDLIVSSEDVTYQDLWSVQKRVLQAIGTYLFYKVKLGFDSETLSSSVIKIFEESCKELEYRLNAYAEYSETDSGGENSK